MTPKRNCWEFMMCGREPDGANVQDLGVCPAATDERLSGVHEGKNSGRACWIVVGTLCEDTVQGTHALNIVDCMKCDFYKLVQREESTSFMPAKRLRSKMRQLSKSRSPQI